MKILTAALLAAATISCASAYRAEPRQPESERVVGSDVCLDIAYCAPFHSFYRPGSDPQIGAVYWLLSNQGHACVVNDADFVRAVPGALWACASGWRFRRG
jgi:hypothetical protein